MVLSGPSNAYGVPETKAGCVRVIFPKMIPFPFRVFVIVIKLLPVFIVPEVILTVGTVMLLKSVTTLAEELLFTVST